MPSTLSPAALHVGAVDQRGVDLAELHLGQRRLDVLLQGVGHGGDAGRLRRPSSPPRRRAPRARRGRLERPAFGEVGQPGRPLPGLPSGTAITSAFSVKTVRVAGLRPASVTTFICACVRRGEDVGGAPWVIWVASAELPAKLNVHVQAGVVGLELVAEVGEDSVSDAAANTVSVPLRSPRRTRALDDDAAVRPTRPPQPVRPAPRRRTQRSSATLEPGTHGVRICGRQPQPHPRGRPLPTRLRNLCSVLEASRATLTGRRR